LFAGVTPDGSLRGRIRHESDKRQASASKREDLRSAPPTEDRFLAENARSAAKNAREASEPRRRSMGPKPGWRVRRRREGAKPPLREESLTPLCTNKNPHEANFEGVFNWRLACSVTVSSEQLFWLQPGVQLARGTGYN
jgi:hypothetical protein